MLCLLDCRTDGKCAEKLKSFGFEVLCIPRAEYLSSPVASHPDMVLFCGLGRLFCHAKYYSENKELIDKISRGVILTLSDEETGDKYPYDVLFNCVTLGKYLLCNQNTVSKLILEHAQKKGLEILHTRQGYTKCSVCKVAEDAIITSDTSIHKVCLSHGIDSLLIPSGNIILPDMDCGFIGGASGVCGDFVYFCGDVDGHPSGNEIRAFCQAHKKGAVSLSDSPLFDCGSILFV